MKITFRPVGVFSLLLTVGAVLHLAACERSARQAGDAVVQDSAAASTATAGPGIDASIGPDADIGRITGVTGQAGSGPVPAIAWIDRKGATHSLDDYRGNVVVLNFWGTWCPPCRAELPDLVALQKAYADSGLQVIGVALERLSEDQVPGHLATFAQDAEMRYPVVYAGNDLMPGLMQAFGGIDAVPTTFIVATDGTIAKRIEGAQSLEEFRTAVEPLLKPAG